MSPGLAAFPRLPPAERRGVVFAMAARGVPVIHLLYIKGLCDRYRLPWDPRPLPEPGRGPALRDQGGFAREFLPVVAAAYLALGAGRYRSGECGPAPAGPAGPEPYLLVIRMLAMHW